MYPGIIRLKPLFSPVALPVSPRSRAGVKSPITSPRPLLFE